MRGRNKALQLHCSCCDLLWQQAQHPHDNDGEYRTLQYHANVARMPCAPMMHHLRFIITPPTYTVHEYISSASVRMNFSGKNKPLYKLNAVFKWKNRLLLLWSRIRLRFNGWHTVPHLKGGHPKQIYPSSLVPLVQYFGRPNWCVHVHTSIHIHTYTYTYCIYIYVFFAVPTDRGNYIYIYQISYIYLYISREGTFHATCRKSHHPMSHLKYHMSQIKYHISHIITYHIPQTLYHQ